MDRRNSDLYSAPTDRESVYREESSHDVLDDGSNFNEREAISDDIYRPINRVEEDEFETKPLTKEEKDNRKRLALFIGLCVLSAALLGYIIYLIIVVFLNLA